MKSLSLIIITIITLSLVACQTAEKEPQKDETSKEKTDNLLYTAKNWKADTDTIGSSAWPDTMVVRDGLIEVDFTLKKKEESEIVFIELICQLEENLSSYSGLKIEYACDSSLAIKLSQSDFSSEGNETYSHYQYVVPASDTIHTLELKFANFTQPTWTPEESKVIPLILENVKDIYLTPTVHEDFGGNSKLAVKGLYLQK